jgi:DNA gyrase inhibitor GyrI
MLTLPRIVQRDEQHYVAVREKVALKDMRPVVDRAFGALYGWLGRSGVAPAGAAFFRYNLIDMAGLCDIEFCVPVTKAAAPEAPVTAGSLPAGRYGQLTWTGPYDALFDVNAVLSGWAREKGIRWDVTPTPEGDRFAARFEVYENNPAEVSAPNELVTTVAIKVAD